MSVLKGKRVLVTGANGFIGARLCKRLVEAGADVSGLVHHGTENLRIAGAEGKVKARRVELANAGETAKAIKAENPELCFHLAAVSSTRAASENMGKAFQANVQGTFNILDTAREAESAVCFASTVKVYGYPTQEGFGEEDALQGKTAYAATKVCGEALCRLYAHTFGLSSSIARIGNTYGMDTRRERLVTGAICSALQNENPVVKGTGESEFDWVFVEDAVSGLIALGERMGERKMAAEPFNIGSGKAASVRQVAEKIIGLSGASLEIEFRGNEKPTREMLRIEKAEKELGWKPQHSLEEGLRKTVEWLAKRKEMGESPF